MQLLLTRKLDNFGRKKKFSSRTKHVLKPPPKSQGTDRTVEYLYLCTPIAHQLHFFYI